MKKEKEEEERRLKQKAKIEKAKEVKLEQNLDTKNVKEGVPAAPG